MAMPFGCTNSPIAVPGPPPNWPTKTYGGSAAAATPSATRKRASPTQRPMCVLDGSLTANLLVGSIVSSTSPSAWRLRQLRPLPDPFLAAGVELLLPERDRLLQGVDRLAACVERSSPMGRRDSDDDACLSDLHPAYAVMNRDARQAVLRCQFVAEAHEHRFRHLLECLVFEIQHVAVT